jgi:hypothetical protein
MRADNFGASEMRADNFVAVIFCGIQKIARTERGEETRGFVERPAAAVVVVARVAGVVGIA